MNRFVGEAHFFVHCKAMPELHVHLAHKVKCRIQYSVSKMASNSTELPKE